MASLYLRGVQTVPCMSIFAEEFLPKISSFNSLTRDLRKAGIEIKHLVFLDNKIFIESSSVRQLHREFGDELRGIRYSTEGRVTRNTVTVRGVDVTWLSQVKEQDQ
ncbi:hypothetical protein BLL42_23725 [Pseudomonas frederiksbergensis]|uniref:Uncharacterized protein n=2 Tax=Pseudomonas frederiksbergensis TaxID=104087 RepID=A0A1J0ERE1_9PSED|nr:hypothetical protein BLL42_23725 [Pseudomonas frederiksbergensis]